MPKNPVKLAVRRVDFDWVRFTNLIKSLKDSKAHVQVGVLDDGGKGSEKREGGLSNAEIAAIHEFGSSDGRIPERSFVRSTFDANHGEYVANLKTLLTRVMNGGMDVERMFNILGAKIAADIKKRVTAGEPIPPPNAPSTTARKRAKGAWNGIKGATGTIRTLVDTGRMIASVTWAYVNGIQTR